MNPVIAVWRRIWERFETRVGGRCGQFGVGSPEQRFNAYVSVVLDGEMAEAHPGLAGKPARIELRCAHMPDTRALELLGLIHDQLAFQEVKLEVVVRNQEPMTKSE